MQMPSDIANFEKLWLISILIGIVQSAHSFQNQEYSRDSYLIVLVIQSLTVILMLVLVFMASRKKSRFCKYFLVLMFIIGIPFYIPFLADFLAGALNAILSVTQLFFQAFGLYFLFREKK